MIDFIFNLTPGDVIYDVETYPNVFTLSAVHAQTKQEWVFEISDRKNEVNMLCLFFEKLSQFGCRMVGFNNINFDYPVIHHIYKNKRIISVKNIYDKAMSIINSYDDKFSHIIWENDRIVNQVDLFKIHHFDNKNKSASLKVLEFNMRSESIEMLPYEVGTVLTSEQIDVLIKYNKYDVEQTLKFYEHTLEKIKFREELSVKYGKNFINHNDTKIGKDYFIMELEKYKPGSCYKRVNGKRKARQTIRQFIDLKDVILPYVKFESSEFNRILSFFKLKRISETKGVFEKLNCTINGFTFGFGTGGIHGSLENQTFVKNDQNIIEDWDVTSYYPSLSIANNLYPEHLGEKFCEIYKDTFDQRSKYKKGTIENAMLKLALNGVYGDTNNVYSPFYDPQYTMSITINGQLLLCMIADQLLKTDAIQIIQINTDGLTLRYPLIYQKWVHSVMKWWEETTKLSLEHAEYNRMFVRDVNNYIAETTDGKVKRKGAYAFDLEWHKDYSALVVAKCASHCLLDGGDTRSFIMNHDDEMDFMLRTKLPRNHVLKWGGEQVQNVTRYYVSTNGNILEKIMPRLGPKDHYKRKPRLLTSYYQKILAEVGNDWDERIHTQDKKKYELRLSGIHPGWTVQICNKLTNANISDINYEFYIQEAEKLIEGAGGEI